MNTQNSQPRRRAALRGAARLRDAASGGTKKRTRLPFPVFLVLVTAMVTLTSTAVRAFSTPAGSAAVGNGVNGVLGFIDFFAGVITLVSLTGAVVFGLIATNQSLLTPHHRVLVQAVHRGISTAALLSLALHISIKVMFGEAAPVDAVVPLGGIGTPIAVGMGTIAGHLMIAVAVTGMLRGRFANGKYPWLWRPMHLAAYASWPIAIAHGLTAGRTAKAYVLWGYGLCMAAVALAVLVRALGSTGKGAAEVESTRKLMARDLALSASARAAEQAGRTIGGVRAEALLTRDIPIPTSAPTADPTEASSEPTKVFPTRPSYYPDPDSTPAAPAAPQPMAGQAGATAPTVQPQPAQPVYQQRAPQQQSAPQPVGATLDTGEFAAQFAEEWDTGELNALLDVGRRQYAAAQAAGVPYTGDPYAAGQYPAAPQYPGSAYPAQSTNAQSTNAQYPTAQQPGPAYAPSRPQPLPVQSVPVQPPMPQPPAAGYPGGPYPAGSYPSAQQPGYAADPFATGPYPQAQVPGVTLGAAAAPLQYFPQAPAAPADPFATGFHPQVPTAAYGYPATAQPQQPAAPLVPNPTAPGAGPAYGSVPAAFSADPWQAR